MSTFQAVQRPRDYTNIESMISYYEQSRNYLSRLNDQLIGKLNYIELPPLPIFNANNVVGYHLSVSKYFTDLSSYFSSVK